MSYRTHDFTDQDTVRNNKYMKKLSNLKSRQTNYDLKNLDLNKFKQIFEDCKVSGLSLLDQYVKSKNPEVTSTQTQTENTAQQTEDTTDQTINQNLVSFADLIEDNQTQTIKSTIDDPRNTDPKIPIISMSYDQLLETGKEEYLQRSTEYADLETFFHLKKKRAVLLIGYSGIGKTLLARSFAKQFQYPLVELNVNATLTAEDLLGNYELVNNNTAFVLGVIPQAIITANDPNNKTKKAVILLDEALAGTPEFQKGLNETLRFKDGIRIPHLNQKYTLNADSEILVICTSNPTSFQAVYDLNRELGSRFKVIPLDDLTDKDLTDLIKRDYKKLDVEFIDNTLRLRSMINQAEKEDTLDQGLDTREIIKFCEYVNYQIENTNTKPEIAIQKAVTSDIYGKFKITDEPEQIRFVAEQIESCFGITDLKFW